MKIRPVHWTLCLHATTRLPLQWEPSCCMQTQGWIDGQLWRHWYSLSHFCEKV